jgi:hypothetical protein
VPHSLPELTRCNFILVCTVSRSIDSLRLKADLGLAQGDLERGYADLAYMLGQKGAGAADLYAYGGVDSPRGISKARARILAAKHQLERLSEPDAFLPSYYRHTKVPSQRACVC